MTRIRIAGAAGLVFCVLLTLPALGKGAETPSRGSETISIPGEGVQDDLNSLPGSEYSAQAPSAPVQATVASAQSPAEAPNGLSASDTSPQDSSNASSVPGESIQNPQDTSPASERMVQSGPGTLTASGNVNQSLSGTSGALATPGETAGSAPEATDAVLEAVGRAMGGEPETVAADAAAPPQTSKETGFGALLGRVVGVLAFILGLLYVSLLGMKKMMGRNQTAVGSRIQVLGRTPLSPKANVYLLRFQDRYFLVGEAGERLTSLASLPVDDSVEIEDGDAVGNEDTGADEPEAGSLRDLFSRPAAEAEKAPERPRMEAGSGGSEKNLRQDAINLLKIQLGVSGASPGSLGSGRDAGRPREARAGAS